MQVDLLTPWIYQTRPFRIFGNLYFVGNSPASTHLIDTGDGLVIIDTRVKDVATQTKPKLLIHSVTLRSDSILWGGFGEMPEMLAELNHNENELHFTFSLDQTPIEGNTFYRYRLNNGSWSAWSTNTSANFTNLAHGIYTFSVQARDVTNRLTDITSIQFVIKTPFYLRWYMNLVYVLLLLIFVYLLFRLRLRKLGKDKERLERLVQERTAEVVRLEKIYRQKEGSDIIQLAYDIKHDQCTDLVPGNDIGVIECGIPQIKDALVKVVEKALQRYKSIEEGVNK